VVVLEEALVLLRLWLVVVVVLEGIVVRSQVKHLEAIQRQKVSCLLLEVYRTR
jgi:hypothetical protein